MLCFSFCVNSCIGVGDSHVKGDTLFAKCLLHEQVEGCRHVESKFLEKYFSLLLGLFIGSNADSCAHVGILLGPSLLLDTSCLVGWLCIESSVKKSIIKSRVPNRIIFYPYESSCL